MRYVIIFVLVAVSTALVTVPVRAADQDLTDQQLSQIRQNCKQAQSVLQRLQTTDVATRVSRGRVYENLITKLITPFDTRVTSNNYSAADLSDAALAITRKFNDFKTDYSVYANSFASLLSVNCEADPGSFYNLLLTARTERGKVSDDIAGLDAGLSRYNDSFTALRMSLSN